MLSRAMINFFRQRASIAIALLGTGGLLLPAAWAQSAPAARVPDPLHQLNDSIEALVRRVAPTVVQISVSGYGSTDSPGETNVIISKRRAIGSGAIVDPDGYIVTNAHVVKGAEEIEVLVSEPEVLGGQVESALAPRARNYEGRVVGISNTLDLAVLKIDAHDLPALVLHKTPLPKQGEVVFAFGSPEGLRNSVTMGVVSTPARQPDPDSPLVYVQTDTPINPGNSGGPLVDADGKLVGINTFILSSSGGNQGLGFAIPAGAVAYAYPQILKYGHMHRPEIGAILQTITPDLAAGLRLPRNFGVIVSDVIPGGPADRAGLKTGDVIVTVDGISAESLPLFTQSLYMHKAGEVSHIEVLRGTDRVSLDIPLQDRPEKMDALADSVDPVKSRVGGLGILGVELTVSLAHTLPGLRIPSGIIVAAKTAGARGDEVPLVAGDVVHAVNGTPVTTLADLRAAVAQLKSGDPVALWIERDGQLIYVSFSL